MRLHLRLITIAVVALGLIGGVLAVTVFNTDEGSSIPQPGSSVGGAEVPETGTTLDYAQSLPLAIEGPLLGANLTAYSAEGYAQESVKRDVQTLADLGSTAITVVPTWYMKSATANRIAPDPDKTPTDESLIKVIHTIREAGLQVILKPHVDVIDDTYRGEIQPVNRSAWYRSYGEFLDHYTSLATENSVDIFVMGTELKTLSAETGNWQALIQMVRDRFFGPITYAANWDEVDQVQFWSDLDAIGVDAYYPLSPDDGSAPTLKGLVASWKKIAAELKAKSEQWERPILLTEVGYPSQVGATAKPYAVTDKPADQNVQALAFKATFQALSGADWLKGISWWSWRADPSGDERLDVDYTPEMKKAQGELAAGQFTFIGR